MWEKSKINIEEEETKVRKNLSRLIHTLQHFPTTRTGLDPSSLWNIVEELESFNLDKKSKSVHFAQPTERKPHIKRNPDIHFPDEKWKNTYALGSGEAAQRVKSTKPGQPYCQKCVKRNCNQLKEKDFKRPKVADYSSDKQKCKDLNQSNKNGMKTNGTLKSVRGKKQNLEQNNKNRNSNSQRNIQLRSENIPQNKNKQKQLKDSDKKFEKTENFKDSVKKVDTSKERTVQSKLQTNNVVEATKENKRPNRTTRNQIGNFRSKSHQCTPKSNEALQRIISGDNQSSIDRKNVVKKLTNYWNNLLNNEFEDNSITTESTGGSCQNFHIDRSPKGSVSGSEKSNSTIKSRHKSESNIDIMRRVDDLRSKNLMESVKNSSSKSENRTVPDKPPVDTPPTADVNILGTDQISNDCIEIDQFSVLHTNEVIRVLQDKINILNSFPNSNIDSVTKKLLYVMVTLSTTESHQHEFIGKIEGHLDKIIDEIIGTNHIIDDKIDESRKPTTNTIEDDTPVGHISSTCNNNTRVDMEYIVDDDEKEESTDPSISLEENSIKSFENNVSTTEIPMIESVDSPPTSDPGSSLVPLTPRINPNTVENALNMFMIWKEIMWPNWSYGYDKRSNYSSHSFTIIYEEDIIIEEDCDDEDYIEDEIVEDDSDTECEVKKDMIRSASARIEKYVDELIDTLENYFQESPEVLIRMLYQVLVSILVWWVLVKEIFIK